MKDEAYGRMVRMTDEYVNVSWRVSDVYLESREESDDSFHGSVSALKLEEENYFPLNQEIYID